MRSALFKQSSDSDKDPGHWKDLPGLCCRAAGGETRWADEISQAWSMFYVGSGILDKIEDRDLPDAWWADTGESVAANAASGLYFTASLLLNRLHNREETCEPAGEIVEDFYRSLLTMSSGQHRDLTTPEPTLKEYWEITTARAGSFFSLACRCGARLAAAEPSRVSHFSDYGLHLGILLQILDDLEDLNDIRTSLADGISKDKRRSLPLVYLRQVSLPGDRIRIRELLGSLHKDQAAGKELVESIDRAGTAIYLLTEIERQRSLALASLEKANPDPETGSKLVAMVPKIEGT